MLDRVDVNEGAGSFVRQVDTRLGVKGLAEAPRIFFQTCLGTRGQLVIGYMKVPDEPWFCCTDIGKAAP